MTNPNTNPGGRKKNNHTSTKNHSTPTIPKFKGNCIDLEGYLFDCSNDKQADKYMVTVKRISEYVGAEYKYGGDIRLCLINEKKMVIKEPESPPDPVDPNNLTSSEKMAECICRGKVDVFYQARKHS